jgi:disulfide bond formation protein DsbB
LPGKSWIFGEAIASPDFRGDERSKIVLMKSAVQAQSPTATLAVAAVTVIAAATLIGAWIFQYGFNIVPCELCLEQRYAYYFVIPAGAVLAIAASRGLDRRWVAFGLLVLGLATLANAGLATYHSGVEWGWWKGPTACTGPMVDFGKAGNLLEQLNKVKVVRCDEVQWRFLGLSLAGYNVLISLLMSAIALWGALKQR